VKQYCLFSVLSIAEM